jgi:hypothetical protein
MLTRSDVVPLGAATYERLPLDKYFTVDPVCLAALLDTGVLNGASRIIEPAAGIGHLVEGLRGVGYTVEAQDIVAHPDPIVDDIIAPRSITEIDSLAGFDAVVTNLPYDTQDVLLKHLLPIAHRDGAMVCTLTRAAWHMAKARRKLVHEDPYFLGVAHLPRRPWWSENRVASPRFEFVWNIWGAEKRQGERPVIFYPRS